MLQKENKCWGHSKVRVICVLVVRSQLRHVHMGVKKREAGWPRMAELQKFTYTGSTST